MKWRIMILDKGDMTDKSNKYKFINDSYNNNIKHNNKQH